MSLLSALIQKRETRKAATAIPAISATQHNEGATTVARIATVAVANLTEAKTANAATSWGWLVHFADRDPVEVYCDPHETHAGILKCYPDALGATPIPERIKRVFTEAENAEWEALWPDTLDWDGPTPGSVSTDDRRRCTQCRRLNPLGRCIAAERGEIVAAKTHTPIKTILRRCEGYMPRAGDPDTRPGRERWPELIRNQETLQ